MGASLGCGNARSEPLSHALEGHAADQFLRSLSFIQAGAGDINEMFLAAQECGSGADPLQWSKSWEALAERTYEDGKRRIVGNPSGASTALLRSCNYSRTSAFFIRLRKTARAQSHTHTHIRDTPGSIKWRTTDESRRTRWLRASAAI